MKSKFVSIIGILAASSLLHAATWYADSGSAAINAVTWHAISGGSCVTGSGATVTISTLGKNDTLNANGCTALAVNVDPGANYTTLTGTLTLTSGSTAVTGVGTLFSTQVAADDWIFISGQPPARVASVTSDTALVLYSTIDTGLYMGATTAGATAYDGLVTLTTDTTNGGAFTYVMSTNLSLHTAIGTSASVSKTTILTLAGSTGGLILIGPIYGGGTSAGWGVGTSHSTVTLTHYGLAKGGAASTTYGLTSSTASGPVTQVGPVRPGATSTSFGFYIQGTGTYTMTGSCWGSDTVTVSGCNSAGSAGSLLILIGSKIDGLKSTAVQGPHYFTPSATNYSLSPKDASYVAGTIDSHATEMPTNPGVGNVSSGVVYGSFTGTLSGGSRVCAQSSW